ncbi:MAG: ATP synthase F1 subunit epsilon [Proteobacteria bacterium]|nr:ATP synthase F1 subunit epsilon [Pseudomonadota bacterium]
MSTAHIAFELVSPESLVLSEQVEMVVIPGIEGDMGILPKHAATVTTLRPGLVDIYKGGKIDRRIFVSSGFANVHEEGCTVLAEECVFLKDLDIETLEQQISNARDELLIARTVDEKETLQKDLELALIKRDLYKRLLR